MRAVHLARVGTGHTAVNMADTAVNIADTAVNIADTAVNMADTAVLFPMIGNRVTICSSLRLN